MRTTFSFFATLVMVALCAVFTSCGSDDEDKNGGNPVNPLVGTWEKVIEEDGEIVEIWTWTFYADYTDIFTEEFIGEYENKIESRGTYSYDPNTQKLDLGTKNEDGTYNIATVKISGNKLILDWGWGDIDEYTRKK